MATLCNSHILNLPISPPLSHYSTIVSASPLNLKLTNFLFSNDKSKTINPHEHSLVIKKRAYWTPNSRTFRGACARLNELNSAETFQESNEKGGGQDDQIIVKQQNEEDQESMSDNGSKVTSTALDEDLRKAVQKTAATFAPRASTASKNPAVRGTVLYTVFEVQAYASMLVGGALSFNLLFPSSEPDIWRLMGMWSIWMFTIPSLRARDCSKNEKEALNYLFILVPLLNVLIPVFWRSFAVVWSADTVAFLGMYAWKLGWLQSSDKE